MSKHVDAREMLDELMDNEKRAGARRVIKEILGKNVPHTAVTWECIHDALQILLSQMVKNNTQDD